MKGQIAKSLFVGTFVGVSLGYLTSNLYTGLMFGVGACLGDLTYSMYKKVRKRD